MAEEREVTISIKAKNLTKEEFDRARRDLLGLGDAAKDAEGKAGSMGAGVRSALGVVATAATAVVGAIGAVGAAVVALGARGSTVTDIRAQFDTLNTSIGNTGSTMLSQLRSATAGTISDFELMKSTNVGLSQGLRLTEDQFGLTGKAARVLADRVGGDTAQAYDVLVQAMATGQDKTLKQIGLNIDAASAVEAHARALGVEKGELSESEQTTAKRNAILAEMNRVLEESGEAEVDFADRLDQGKAMLANFVDGLAEGIAESPVFAAALDAAGESLQQAVGEQQGGLIRNIISLLEQGAIVAMDLGDVGLSVADGLARGFYYFRGVLFDLLGSLFDIEAGLAGVAATASEWTSSLPGATDSMKSHARGMREHADVSKAMAQSMKDTASEAHSAAQGNNTFSQTVGQMKTALTTVRGEMERARQTQGETKTETESHTKASTALGVSLDDQGERARAAKAKLDEHKKEQKEAEKAAKALKDTLDKIEFDAYIARLNPLNEEMKKGLEASHNEILKQVDTIQEGLLPSLDELPVIIGRSLTPQEQSRYAFQRMVEGATELKGSVEDSSDEIEELRDRSNEAAVSIEDRWGDGLSNLSAAFSDLAEIGGAGLDGLIGKVAELVGLMNVGSQAGRGLAEVFRNRDSSGNIIAAGKEGAGLGLGAFRNSEGKFSFSSMSSGAMGAASAGIGAYGSLMEATDVAGRGNRALRGAATGAAIGTQILPGWGTAIGAGVGALVGALRNPAWEQSMKRVGQEWGEKITEETGRSIAETAKKVFKGDKFSAELFSMDKILGDAGGLSDKNIGKMTGKLHDVFSMIEMGKFTTEQATEVLNKNFGAFADYYTKTGKLVSKEFQHILELNEHFGTNSQAIREFINNEIGAGVTGFATWLQTGQQALDGMAASQAQLTELEAQYAAASDADRPRIKAQIDEVSAALNTQKDLHAAVGITSQESAGAAGAALGAMFAELQEGGLSTREALIQIQPAADSLEAQLQQAGFTGGEAFDQIRKFSALARHEVAGPALDAVQGLGRGLSSLHNTGLLNQEMFSGLSSQVARTRDTLISQGHDGDAAMRMMQPTLQTIWELQEKFGYTVDESTQAMLDQAEEAGIVGAKHKDANERIADSLTKVADKLGTLVDQLATTADGADRAADRFGRIRDVVEEIPRNIEVEVTGTYTPPEIPEGGYAEGTYGRHGRWFMNFGGGTRTWLHGEEAVVPKDDVGAFVRAMAPTVFGRSPATAPSGDAMPAINLYVAMENGRPALISQEEYILRVAQRGLSTGHLQVPTRNVVRRAA